MCTEIILQDENIEIFDKFCELQHRVNHIQPHMSNYFQQYAPYT